MRNEELIQKYFSDTLSSQEEKKLSSLLENDKDFKAQFDEFDDMHKAFKANEAEKLKFFLKYVENNSTHSKLPWFKKPMVLYLAAAVVIIGLCIPFLINPSPNQLYNDYFEVYPNVEQPIVRGNNETEVSKVFQDYENNNFDNASKGFESLLAKEDNPNFRFYYAMSLLNTKNYGLALKELSKLESIDFNYKDETLWYQALIYVKFEKTDHAKSKLEILDRLNSSFKSKERKVLLKKL